MGGMIKRLNKKVTFIVSIVMEVSHSTLMQCSQEVWVKHMVIRYVWFHTWILERFRFAMCTCTGTGITGITEITRIKSSLSAIASLLPILITCRAASTHKYKCVAFKRKNRCMINENNIMLVGHYGASPSSVSSLRLLSLILSLALLRCCHSLPRFFLLGICNTWNSTVNVLHLACTIYRSDFIKIH